MQSSRNRIAPGNVYFNFGKVKIKKKKQKWTEKRISCGK